MDERRTTGDSDREAETIAFLGSGRAFGQDDPPVRIDTHCAIVFLAGDAAWKLKKPVKLGYLDFSTAEKRRDVLDAELRLNRRTAPVLYRAVHSVNRAPDGRLAIDGKGECVDWLLEMRRFPAGALLDRQLEQRKLSPDLLMRLADRIAGFHAHLAGAPVDDGADRLARIIDGNVASMTACDGILGAGLVRLIVDKQRAELATARSLLDLRGRTGRVRHGHGDLHLANIAVLGGEPTLFDCLEFDDALATTDVLYDIAFLLMDLWHRDARDAANMILNRYLDVSPKDEDCLALLPLFLSVRATIRAHVTALQSLQAGGDPELAAQARGYLDLAFALLTPAQPRLAAIGGLSGTGKSSVARRVGGHVGRPPGARILRSDVVRKRLAGVTPETVLPRESYTKESGRQVYTTLGALARAALRQGQSVIVDAVFADPDERSAMASIAASEGVPFTGFWLQVDDRMRIDRIGARSADASDADIHVAQEQTGRPIGDLAGWIPMDATKRESVCAAGVIGQLDSVLFPMPGDVAGA